MLNFDDACRAVIGLAQEFQSNRSHYQSPTYQEAEVRKDFVDKLFKILGWDVDHDQQKNPYEQEVKVERSQAQGRAKKRADYAFLVDPNFRDVRFFVEAKKPSREIENADDYFQAIRYGWNAQNPIAVLTDFEQFHVLDCRYKPNIDTALSRAVRKYTYLDFLDQDKFSEIYFLFSRDAVANGAIEKFASTLPRIRGGAKQFALFKADTRTIDEGFLEELEDYRLALARAFFKKNSSLDSDTLTEITQRTIDRLVFIRFLEDRLIESESIISQLGTRATAWQDFIAHCRRLDRIYNGIIFKTHPIIDDIAFSPDDEVFANICEQLSDKNSPYDFNTIPIHILGSIYERFLGSTIQIKQGKIKVEQKPEVRKAGGVYYTPEYVSTYLVERTVGEVLRRKNPRDVTECRFADIACGSGSFLLAVYDYLLRWHLDYYTRHPRDARKGDLIDAEDGPHLSLKKRQEILVNNIFGIDIDHQAVEVAQLSLYLRLIQEETAATKAGYQLEFGARLLPPLVDNIVCGNAVIGTDILDGNLFERDAERQLNPLDIGTRFKRVISAGGFHAIIGNPPMSDRII